MTALTQFSQKKMLDKTLGLADYSLPTVHVALFTTSPGETGSLSSEVVGGSYARVALSGKLAATVLATGVLVNNATILFPTATGSWGIVSHWGVCDASSAGNVLLYGPLSFSRLITSGALPVQFLAGAFSITARSTLPNEMTQYLAKKWLDHIMGVASFTMPTNVFVGLSTTDPGATGSLSGEIAGGSYARQNITTKMGATTLSTGQALNNSTITFPTPSATWNVSYHLIADASSAGNVLYRMPRQSTIQLINGSPALRVEANQLLLEAA